MAGACPRQCAAGLIAMMRVHHVPQGRPWGRGDEADRPGALSFRPPVRPAVSERLAVTSRWPDPSHGRVNLGLPVSG